MKSYFRVWTNACICAKSHELLTEDELQEYIWNSLAYESYMIEHKIIYENEDATEEMMKLDEEFLTEALKDAEEREFNCGDFYLYIRNADFDIYEINRHNC